MNRPDQSARQVLADFALDGTRARWHTTLRWMSCPFPAVEALLPTDGHLLDVGCGHGLFAAYLARCSPGRHVVGVDIDGAKIAIGTRAVVRAGLGGRVELAEVGEEWLPVADSYDAVVVTDVLYLLGRERATAMLAALAAAVRPGGRLVVKEVGTTPRWKYRVNEIQERLSTRVLGITEGDRIEVLPVEEIVAPLQAAGLRTDVRRLDRGYPHAHLAVIGDRPAGG